MRIVAGDASEHVAARGTADSTKAPLSDLGEALEVAALLDRAALALGPFEAGAEPLLGFVHEIESESEVPSRGIEARHPESVCLNSID